MGMIYGAYSALMVPRSDCCRPHAPMHFIPGAPSRAEHFIRMGKVFLALVCVGVFALLVLLVIALG